MLSLLMLSETCDSIESCTASLSGKRVDICTWERGQALMIGTNVALKSLMLPEELVARRVVGTTESVMAFVCFFVSFETG